MSALNGFASFKRGSYVMAADQVVSSLTNTLMVFLLARSLSSADLGRATLAATVLLLMVTVSKALLSEPILLRRQETPLRMAELRSGILLVAGGCTFLGLAPLLIRDPATRSLMLVNLIAIPAVVAQDAVRHVFFARSRPWNALFSDLIWLGSFLISLQYFSMSSTPSGTVLYACWALSAWPALVVAPGAVIGSLRSRPFNFDRALRPYWTGALYALGVGMVANQLQVFGLGLTLGLASLGAFKGAASLFGLVNLASQAMAVPLLLRLRYLAESGRYEAESRRLRLLTTFVGAGLGTGILAIAYLAPLRMGIQLLGETWTSARAYLPAWYVSSMAGSFAFFDAQRIRSLGLASKLAVFGIRILPVTVGVPLAGAYFGGVNVFAALWAAGAVVSAIGLRQLRKHWDEEQRSLEFGRVDEASPR